MINKNNIFWFLFLIIFFSFSCGSDKDTAILIQPLDQWQYSMANKDIWRRAFVPSSIQTLLQSDTLFKGLFLKGAFKSQRWCDSLDWEYQTKIYASKKLLSHKNIYLTFERIDTYADIYLNDSLILRANNFFRPYQLNIRYLLKEGDNYLRVKLISPYNFIKSVKPPYFLPYKGLEYIRKPFYHYDTTNNILYTPIGLGQVYLKMWDLALLDDVWFKTLNIDYQGKTAQIQTVIKVFAQQEFTGKITVSYRTKVFYKKEYIFKRGLNTINFVFPIQNVRLWWTHDLGEPFVYTFKVELTSAKKLIDKKITNFGVREIQIDTTEHRFRLKLNGKSLYIKAVEHLPLKLFYQKVSKEDFNKYFSLLKNADINTLYCSSKGYYEDDKFYDLCDRNGIIVWQDFMLPYFILPNSSELRHNIEKEIFYQIERLRNHPSIAFWSTSKRINKVWRKYREKYTTTDSVKIFNYYNKLVEMIRNIVNQKDDRIYLPQMNFYSLVLLKDRTPSFPSPITLYSSVTKTNLTYDSNILNSYIKPYNTIKQLTEYVKKISDLPVRLENFVYLTQLYTYKNYLSKLQLFRFNYYFNGLIVSNFKDITPVISPSAVDYKFYSKGKYYAIVKSFKPITAKIDYNNDWLHINIITDYQENTEADVYFKLYKFNGKTLWRKNYPHTILKGLESKNIFAFDMHNILKNNDLNQVVLKIEVYQNQELVYEDYYFFAPNKRLELQEPNIQVKLLKVEDGVILELSSDYLAKDVYLYTPIEGIFSDNFFNIIPGESKKIHFYTLNTFDLNRLFIIDYTKRLNADIFLNVK